MNMKNQIPPFLMSEANIQAEFYACAKNIGLKCTLGFKSPVGVPDIAILNNDWTELVAIVECKHNHEKKVSRTRQIDRYLKLGVPVYGLADFDRAGLLAKRIMERHLSGKPILAVLEMPRIYRCAKPGKPGRVATLFQYEDAVKLLMKDGLGIRQISRKLNLPLASVWKIACAIKGGPGLPMPNNTNRVREPDWGNCVWENGRVGSGGLGPGDPLPPSRLRMFDSPNNAARP